MGGLEREEEIIGPHFVDLFAVRWLTVCGYTSFSSDLHYCGHARLHCT